MVPNGKPQREMNKPCVMSTVYGTQYLTDGEIVEVNAELGIVRKIRRT
jgi:hypothetical protein